MQLQKTSALRNLFIFKAPPLCANHFFLTNHTRKLRNEEKFRNEELKSISSIRSIVLDDLSSRT